MAWQPWMSAGNPRTATQYGTAPLQMPQSNDYYAAQSAGIAADPTRGRMMRGEIPSLGAQHPQSWGDVYGKMASGSGFTGDVGNTVAQAGAPATGDPYGLAAMRGGVSSGAAPTAAAPAAGAGAAPGATSGALPPINPGEDSMAYMLRIGMSQADAQAAAAMAQQNPGMSFQDILARMHGGGSTGNIANPTTQGVSLGNLTSPQGSVNGVPGYTGGGSFNLANWQDPGYAFRLQQGLEGVQGSAAAQGNLLSGPTLKALTDYGQNSASQEYQNAFNRFSGNRQFNYNADVGDRAFDYMAQTGDRDFNYGVARDLASEGQFGAGGAADTNRLLATLISQNMLTGGQANAAATMGTGNLTMDAITRYLQQQAGQSTLDRIFPQKTTP